jgi:hypothetical protein
MIDEQKNVLIKMEHFFCRLSWWCNQLASTIVTLVYTAIFCHFGWRMIDMFFHSIVFSSVLQHIFIPCIGDGVIHFLDKIMRQMTGFSRWWSPYWWVMIRDGPLVLGTLISVIALRYCRICQVELSDSTFYVPINEPVLSTASQRCISRRRRSRRTFRKFHCKLVRVVVFGKNSNRRRSYDYF